MRLNMERCKPLHYYLPNVDENVCPIETISGMQPDAGLRAKALLPGRREGHENERLGSAKVDEAALFGRNLYHMLH